MQTRALLMFAPGHPFSIADLMPQRRLAAAAASLAAAGHDVTIADLGVARYGGRPGTGRRVTSESDAPYGADLMRLTQMAGACDVAVVLVNTTKDLAIATRIGQDLVRIAPHCRRILMGPIVEPFGGKTAQGHLPFHHLLGDNPECELLALLGDAPSTAANRSLDHLPHPLYDRHHYPALHAPGKLLVFALEHTRGDLPLGAGPPSPWRAPQRRTRSAGRLLDEWRTVKELFPTLRGAHLLGRGDEHALSAVSYELRTPTTPLLTARELTLEQVTEPLLRTLAHGNCRAVHFKLDSGSQRMLDNVHEHGFGVTQAETALRLAHSLGLQTTVSMTYPAPFDDYHTRAESMRILTRTKPDGVLLHRPAPCPGSRWWEQPDQYGFSSDSMRMLQWSLGVPYEVAYPVRDGLQVDWADEHLKYLRELREIKMTAGLGPEALLMRSLLGNTRRGVQLVRRLSNALERGSAARVGTLVEAFNRQVHRQARSLALEPFVPVLAAVGN